MNRGIEFLAEFREIIINDYKTNFLWEPPQANAILERVHQTIGNILRTLKAQNMELDDENPRDGI